MTKIDFIRSEFSRIGCPSPAHVLEYRLTVDWHFREILIRGKKVRSIDYDMLVEILKSVPDNAGEERFWEIFESTNMQELADRLNNELLEDFKPQRKTKNSRKSSPKKKIKKISKKRKRS